MARVSKQLTSQAQRPRADSVRPVAEPALLRDRATQAFERNIRASLAGRLGREIVGGVYPPGSLLPNAADMCAMFKVSRTALREAYSVLTAKALIVARPKIGTRVRPKADWNMLDPEVLSWHLQSTPSEGFVAELFALRQMIEPAAAAMAAAAPSRLVLIFRPLFSNTLSIEALLAKTSATSSRNPLDRRWRLDRALKRDLLRLKRIRRF